VIPTLAIAGTRVRIGRLGFGCGRIVGGSEFTSSARLIEAALDAGIRHFDTAPSYGDGRSEAVLGSVLAGVPDATITTKIGIARPDESTTPHPLRRLYRATMRPVLSRFPGAKTHLLRWFGSRPGPPQPAAAKRVLTRDEVLRSLDASLKQLRRHTVDLYLLHEPAQFVLTDELREVFESLQREGTIGAYGLAFDVYADLGTTFGTVCQGRYAFELPRPHFEGTRIFHGVLRHGWRKDRTAAAARTPGEWLGHVLRTCPDSAVIFSASSGRQIETIGHNLA
jgi:hypothetical protein